MALPLGRKLAWSLVPVAALLAAGEIAARLFAGAPPPAEGSRGGQFRDYLIQFAMPPEDADIVLRADPELFWRLAPDTPDVPIRHARSLWMDPATNSLGLRDDEIARPKPPGVLRILCLGDSCTYGSGVLRRNSFPELLQARLGAGVDVVNAGVPGYTSYQAVTWLERDGWQLQPDIIVFALGFNDGRSWDGWTDEEHVEQLRERAGSLSGLFQRSRLLAVLREWWRRQGDAPAVGVEPGTRTRQRVPVDRYAFWLGRAAEGAQAHHARILFLMWAGAGNLDDPADESLSQHQNALRGFCVDSGLPCVNPVAALRPHRATIDLGDGIHMNQKGNAIVAWEIAEELRRLGWVPE